jgi:phosphatidylserine decarboxylase
MNVHRSIIHNTQDVHISKMPINGWINTMRYIHTTEYYSAIET